MTILDKSQVSSKMPVPYDPSPPRRWWGIRAIASRFKRSTRAEPPPTFGGMTHEQFGEFARENPPPQKWFDQDTTGLQGPPR